VYFRVINVSCLTPFGQSGSGEQSLTKNVSNDEMLFSNSGGLFCLLVEGNAFQHGNLPSFGFEVGIRFQVFNLSLTVG